LLWLLGTLMMMALLVLVTAVDLDGDPSTPNIPDVVLIERPILPTAAECKRDETGGDAQVTASTVRRVSQFVRRVERWTILLRRFHRAILTDAPI
jgi:hypothetical protein